MTDHELPHDVQYRLDEHLDAVDAVLRKYKKSRTERSAIVDELANQVIDMLTARTRDSGGGAGSELSIDDLEAVLSELDPPEAYARHSIDLPAEPKVPAFATEGYAPEPRFNRATLYGLVWLVWMALSLMLLYVLDTTIIDHGTYAQVRDTYGNSLTGQFAVESPRVFASQTWWGILLIIFIGLPGLLAPIGTTILGWVGIGQIKRSGGRQHGLGLAAFNALVFICFAISAAVCGLILGVPAAIYTNLYDRAFTDRPDITEGLAGAIGLVVLAAALSLFLCRWLVRAVWRHAEQSPTAA